MAKIIDRNLDIGEFVPRPDDDGTKTVYPCGNGIVSRWYLHKNCSSLGRLA